MSKASDQHAVQMTQARAQLIRAEAEITTLRRVLAEEQHATATLTAALDAAQAERDDLRRQLADTQAKLSELRPVVEQALYFAIDDIAERINTDMTVEASDLRRQLAVCRGKIAADEIAFGQCAAEIEATHRKLVEAQAELADLRRQLEIAQAERDAARAEMSSARMLLGDPVGIDIAIMGLLAERYNLQMDNARMRFYIVELEAASRTIDIHLAQVAANDKFRAAYGEVQS